MAALRNQTVVACTPEQLFDYCVDIRNELEWNPTAVSMEKITEGPVGVGTTFLARWKGAPSALEVECVEYDRPHRWVHVNGGPVAVTFTGSVEPTAGGARLLAHFEARPRGWFRMVFPLFWLMMMRQESANMSRLREALAPARTEEMAVIHRIFRRGLPELADLVRRTPAGDSVRAEPIAAHLDFLLNSLHHHHAGEDALIWPLLLERTDPDAEAIDRMERQHAVVAERSAAVREQLESWRGAPDSGEELALALDELMLALVEHLNDEEAEVVPLIRAHITAAEWTAFGQATFERFTDEEKLIATGVLEEVATREEAEWFTGDLPLPIKGMWRLMGRRRFAAHMARVRG